MVVEHAPVTRPQLSNPPSLIQQNLSTDRFFAFIIDYFVCDGKTQMHPHEQRTADQQRDAYIQLGVGVLRGDRCLS
jgi:hypothetical protein